MFNKHGWLNHQCSNLIVAAKRLLKRIGLGFDHHLPLASVRKFGHDYWQWILTAGIVAVAAVVFLNSKDLNHAAEIGEFVAGFSSALAFLWLIIGLKSQASDLALQRQELGLQRAALEKQATELKNASKFASLASVESILERARARIKESNLGVTEPSELTTLWMSAMPNWKVMLESRDAHRVQATFTEWLKIEALVRNYLSSVTAALKMYLQYNVEWTFDSSKPDPEFIYIYSSWMNNAPFLAEHAGVAYATASMVFTLGPGLESIQLAGLAASAKQFGKEILKAGALEKMRDELIKKNAAIPAIATD